MPTKDLAGGPQNLTTGMQKFLGFLGRFLFSFPGKFLLGVRTKARKQKNEPMASEGIKRTLSLSLMILWERRFLSSLDPFDLSLSLFLSARFHGESALLSLSLARETQRCPSMRRVGYGSDGPGFPICYSFLLWHLVRSEIGGWLSTKRTDISFFAHIIIWCNNLINTLKKDYVPFIIIIIASSISLNSKSLESITLKIQYTSYI